MEGNRHLTFIYKQKETAPTSYYLQEGETGIFPARICITRNAFAQVLRDQYRNPIGQMKATFKLSEASPYRTEKRTLHSNIYPLKDPHPRIVGIGDIRGTNDLLIFEDRSGGDWKEIVIHIYPDCKFKVVEILSGLKLKTPAY